MSRIVLATASTDFEARVRRACPEALNGDLRYWREGLVDGDPSGAASELAERGPDVIAVGPDVAVESALEVARALDRERPDISVVIVTEPSPRVLESALRVGARDVIAPDAPDDVVRDAFARALESADRRRAALEGRADGPDSRRRVISVLCPKGGSGKTTVATNLALGLARSAPGQVVVVDLDLQFGDVASALRLAPEHTFADVARSAAPLDATTAKVFLTHHQSDLFALCAPTSPAEAEELTADHVRRALELLAGEFRYVVIDTPSGIDEATLVAIELSTDLVLLSATDVPSVRATRKEVDALQVIATSPQRWHFVLNRSDARTGLSVEDIESTIELRVDAAIPSSRAVPVSLNQGSPVLESEPRSPAARALAGLVDRFAPVSTTTRAPAASGFWRRKVVTS